MDPQKSSSARPPPADTKAILNYGRAASGTRRLLFRSLVSLVIIGACVLALAVFPRIRLAYLQQSLIRSLSPDRVVYEEDSSQRTALLAMAGYSASIVKPTHAVADNPVVFRPRILDEFISSAGIGLRRFNEPYRSAIVFAGELRTPAGQSRLVIVEFRPRIDRTPLSANSPAMVHVIQPGSLLGSKPRSLSSTPCLSPWFELLSANWRLRS